MPLQERVPPQNVEAERSVLGAIMIKPEALTEVQEQLQPNDFYREAYRVVYEDMLELSEKGEAVDVITLTEMLKKKDQLEKVGGVPMIMDLANAVPTAANVSFHAKIVKEKAELRRLIDAATEIAASAYEGNEDVENIMDDAEKKILAVAGTQTGNGFEPIKSILLRTFDNISTIYANKGGLTGLASGFRDLDKLTNGFQKSDLILIAARPSMGKTAFVLNIASYIGTHGGKVAFFSLEMSKEQLMQRMLASEGQIDSQKLRTGQMDSTEWNRLMGAADTMSRASIYIDDTPGITIMELRSKARRLKAEHGLDIVIIDYLQLMQGRQTRGGDNSRQQEISEISRSLKALARELDVPVIALSQLSRSVESRQVKRPMLSDLRESGSLEQDADIVMFLYREDYYDQETDRKNVTEVIVAKHRNGPIDTVEMYFAKEFTKFRDLSHAEG